MIEEADPDLEQSEVLANASKLSVIKSSDTYRKRRGTGGINKFTIDEKEDRESSVKKR